MKQSDTYIKWFSRIAAVVILILLSYAATRAAYNSAYWVPHSLLRRFDAPYHVILLAEQNIDMALHFLGAALLVWTLWFSQLPILLKSPIWTTGLVASLCIAAEIVQFQIGRGWQWSDLLLGILGSFMAYSTIYKNKQLSS